MGWEEDVHLGESLRGMQESHVGNFSEIGAAQKLAALRGALGSIAQQRFGHHAPTSKQMRSPYKDSTQIGISAMGTFTAQSWAGSALPTISGVTRVYKSFKPTKAILTENLIVMYQNASAGTQTKALAVTDSSDLVLTSAFSGADNCFPNAPNESNGIPGQAFANNSLGNGISWPTINGGIDMSVSFSIEMTALYAIDPPPGFTVEDIFQIIVKTRFALMGPSLR
jgi:hypothetical protein